MVSRLALFVRVHWPLKCSLVTLYQILYCFSCCPTPPMSRFLLFSSSSLFDPFPLFCFLLPFLSLRLALPFLVPPCLGAP